MHSYTQFSLVSSRCMEASSKWCRTWSNSWIVCTNTLEPRDKDITCFGRWSPAFDFSPAPSLILKLRNENILMTISVIPSDYVTNSRNRRRRRTRLVRSMITIKTEKKSISKIARLETKIHPKVCYFMALYYRRCEEWVINVGDKEF